ncbi:MAG TPA: hypothetical protein VFA01_00195, partial [Candidatus Dormibacteraeota bacterium]|nr:hypothetical protein [Candidatus Dormibacteraeota bacterium]
MADFRASEGRKAQILTIRPLPSETAPERANGEWVEIMATEDGDLANWRLMQLRPRWTDDVTRPVAWDWVYTFGSPAFVRAGEIYRIHSGSRVRAATHPEPDDLVPGRKHVYAAGPLATARVRYLPGDYIRLVEAFGAVMDEVIVIAEAK